MARLGRSLAILITAGLVAAVAATTVATDVFSEETPRAPRPGHPAPGPQVVWPLPPLACAVRIGERLVGLSFDDGPRSRYTPQILAVLERFHVHATFFVEGRYVVRSPGLIRDELAAGMEVQVHAWNHPVFAQLSRRDQRREWKRTMKVLSRLGVGRTSLSLWRPPFGAVDRQGVRRALQLGLHTVLWSVYLEALARRLPPDLVVVSLLDRLRPGAIILAHDAPWTRGITLAVLPLLLRGLGRAGYTVEPLGTLLRQGPPVVPDLRAWDRSKRCHART